MADLLADILATKNLEEPDEILIINNFLKQNYQAICQVTMTPRQIIITVKGASLAGALRMRLHELQTLCQTDKKLIIRITG